ncbi:MAG: hypothetical protein AABN33_02115 [Acidobacteriota bacterium]
MRNIAPRRGLIVLVSQGKVEASPAAAAIKYHLLALDHCWLITSTEAQTQLEPPFQSSWKNAGLLKAQCQDHARVHIKVIDPEDPQSIFQSVEQVYAEAKSYGLTSKDVVADFTGGAKMMTAGMVLACTPADRDVQYMKPLAFLPDGQPDRSAGSETEMGRPELLPRQRRVVARSVARRTKLPVKRRKKLSVTGLPEQYIIYVS